jgi:hypothetical protein
VQKSKDENTESEREQQILFKNEHRRNEQPRPWPQTPRQVDECLPTGHGGDTLTPPTSERERKDTGRFKPLLQGRSNGGERVVTSRHKPAQAGLKCRRHAFPEW